MSEVCRDLCCSPANNNNNTDETTKSTSSPPKRIRQQQQSKNPLPLRRIGFCGLDSTIGDIKQLFDIGWPSWVEFGILFRPENEGKPRFPTMDELPKLLAQIRGRTHLAAHLCSSRCQELLDGNVTFLQDVLIPLGFSRIQINATKANGVNSDTLSSTSLNTILAMAKKFPSVEFIIQRNMETKPLWEPLNDSSSSSIPNNISLLFDSSIGRGIVIESFPLPEHKKIKFGYAGGLNPDNIQQVLMNMSKSLLSSDTSTTTTTEPPPPQQPQLTHESLCHHGIWIDMESGIRSGDSQDVLVLDKIKSVVETIMNLETDGVVEMVDTIL
jgi:hypothetical protein